MHTSVDHRRGAGGMGERGDGTLKRETDGQAGFLTSMSRRTWSEQVRVPYHNSADHFMCVCMCLGRGWGFGLN